MKPHKDTLGAQPPCFTPEQWRDYVRDAREAAEEGEPTPPAGFCTNCTAKHQAAMDKRGLCLYPAVQFVDGEGVRVIRRVSTNLRIPK